MKDQDPIFWCYGTEEGDPVEVEIVDLGPEVNAALYKLFQNPTNLTEIRLGGE